MFDVFRKSEQLGKFAAERVCDYLELLRIELEIQGRDLSKRIIALVIVSVSILLSAIFAGLAIVLHFWDTPYRIMAPWVVAAAFGVVGLIVYFVSSRLPQRESAIIVASRELEQDITLAKEII